MRLSIKEKRLQIPSAIVLGAFASGMYLLPWGLPGLLLGIAMILFWIRREGVTCIGALSIGFAFAVTYQFFVLLWAWNAPSFVTSIFPVVPYALVVALVIFTVTLISLVAGFAFLPWTYIAWRYRYSFLIDTVLLSVVWVCSEQLRLFLLSVLSAGDGVFNPPNLSFGMIGYPFADYTPMLPLVHFGGVYALSFLGALGSVLCYYVFTTFQNRPQQRKVLMAIGIVLIVCGVLIFLAPRVSENTASVSVSLVTEYSLPLSPAFNEVLTATAASTSMLLLPEGSRRFAPYNQFLPLPTSLLGGVVIDSGTLPAFNATSKEPPSASSFTNSGHTMIREKKALAPYGEYTPWVMSVFARTAGFAGLLGSFTHDRHYHAGTYEDVVTYQEARATVLFCDEVGVPGIAKGLVDRLSPNIIFMIASTHWFPQSYLLHRETVRMTKIQAVQAGVPIVRSAYGDPAFAVNARGQVFYEASWDRSSVETLRVPIARVK